MSSLFADGAALLGCARKTTGAGQRRFGVEAQIGMMLPEAVALILEYPGLMESIGAVYQGDPMFPDEPRLLDSTLMPGYGGSLLWLLTENQGVCRWGVPLDKGDDPPVIVGGDLAVGARTVEFSPSIEAFVFAFGWDGALMKPGLLLQAQADPLDPASLAYLRAHYIERVTTFGWPGETNHRFENHEGVRVELWNVSGQQCDWMISGPATALEPATRRLLKYSNLAESLWSNDAAGQAMLSRVRRN